MTFVERLTLLSSAAALISSLAALATAVAQVFIARSTNLSAYRIETSKLFFHAKTEAYKDFFRVSQSFLERSSAITAADLVNRCSYALLFSEDDTCKLLTILCKLLMDFQDDPLSPDLRSNLSQAQLAAVEAMRQELAHLQDPLCHNKRHIHSAHKH